MKIFESASALSSFVQSRRSSGERIGFVPTMGALHAGHLSLVNQALKQCDCCIVSVFVNPTQFNDPKDLETYPRTFEADAALLRSAGAHAVLHPNVEEIYPEEDKRIFDVGRVAEVMEGAHRPGHFNGVMQVVSRLFDIVRPDKAFFGEKDFQQIAVVRAMCQHINSPVEIVSCPIVREADGLALSSRNVRLTPAQRKIAPNIYRVLRQSLDYSANHTPADTAAWVTEQINAIEGLTVEYYDIVESNSLESVQTWSEAQHIQGCITVFCGEVRLIDNIPYK